MCHRDETLSSSAVFVFVFCFFFVFKKKKTFNQIHLCIQQLPDLVTQLGVLYHMIESRVKMFHKLTKLHGKLYLLTTQVGAVISRRVHSVTAFGYFKDRILGVLDV